MTGAGDNRVRLAFGVVLAWLVGATGGLAVLPYSLKPIAFCGAAVVFLGVALWNAAPPQNGRWRDGPYQRFRPDDLLAVMERYRLRWLAVLTVVVTLTGLVHAFAFADVALAVIGEPVTAQVERADVRGDGVVVCALTHPDGTPIPGTLDIDGTECPERPDVLVDPRGLFDPVLRTEGMAAMPILSLLLLGIALALCRPAAPSRPDPAKHAG